MNFYSLVSASQMYLKKKLFAFFIPSISQTKVLNEVGIF